MLVGLVNGADDLQECDVSLPEVSEMDESVFMQQVMNGMVVGFLQGDEGLIQPLHSFHS
jgi:hypothetical protein